MAVAEIHGQRLTYEDTGGDGPAVVFSHGLLMDRTMFAPQLAALRDRYRCIAWDERGHGETGPATEPFSFWDSAEDLLALLDQLDVEEVVLAGMSQGGFLSLRAALLAPERVRGLVLLDTQAGLEDPERVPAYRMMLEGWMADGLSDEVAAVIESIIIGQDAPEWRARWQAMPREGLDVALATLFDRDDVTPRLGEIRAPAIVIHGDAD